MDTGIVIKIQKHLDQLKQKNVKLAEENTRLKKLVMDIRSTNSRVRRIPKKIVPVSPADDAAATSDMPVDQMVA
jgi:vacuolar-type H+-ATPase subunit D/Vma8